MKKQTQKKYAIMSGVYSDWRIHGYVSNIEDAYKYCAYKNSVDAFDKYYPVEIPCLDGNYKPKKWWQFWKKKEMIGCQILWLGDE